MCIFKGIIRYRLKNTIINALWASLVQKKVKKRPSYKRGKPPPHFSLGSTKSYATPSSGLQAPARNARLQAPAPKHQTNLADESLFPLQYPLHSEPKALKAIKHFAYNLIKQYQLQK